MKAVVGAVIGLLCASLAACSPDPTSGTPPPPGAAAPAYTASIGPAPAGRMTASWRPGCPVPIEDLRLLTLDHWGFDGARHRGELVVHKDVADDVVDAFSDLYAARFPIERMELVDVHGANDDASMAANNSSGFNCRRIAGSSSWSEHAYGRAIDLNPVQNPYVRGTTVEPPAGAAYLDRSRPVPGVLRAGDAGVRAFSDIGWRWGGAWRSAKDHQHFSRSGR